MNGHRGEMITVLYKVVNSASDGNNGLYNAFQMPRSNGVTLISVKQHCTALNNLNYLGAEGFHWRVCIEDKQPPPSTTVKYPFSWWDIQDEKARLPVKEYSMSQVDSMFMPSISSESSDSSLSKSTKVTLKGLGKAMNAMASAVEGSSADNGPRVPVIAFKLLDLVRMHDAFTEKHGGRKEIQTGTMGKSFRRRPPSSRSSTSANSAPAPPTHTRVSSTSLRAAAPHHQPTAAAPHHQPTARPTPPSARRHTQVPAPRHTQAPATRHTQAPATRHTQAPGARHTPTSNLMDFGHPVPSTPNVNTPSPYSNETRAERLKREYAQKKQKANRIWDDVDQRWVEVDPKAGVKQGSQSAPPQPIAPSSSKKVKGIKLDPANAIGKSASVQAGVHARVNNMKQSQQQAVQEIRQREAKKAASDAEEDEARKRLEPKIKKWSEEHGKKKQLRALIASLHTILWTGANWKQMSIGDLLNDAKVKKAFYKASRVVHPDKTGDLDAEKRFLAKRIFDALSQAKTEFDNSLR